MSEEQVRLTQLTHGGGGGCKVAPDILEKILSGIKPGIVYGASDDLGRRPVEKAISR